MKKILLIWFLIISVAYGQNHALILQDAVHINIDNGAVLTINQTHPDGIVTAGTNTGVINSEGETNRVAWIINNGTGIYTIPFGINSAIRFPMIYQITTAGSASGALTASTYPTPWDNLPHPSVYAPAVTNTGAQYIGGVYEERRHYTLDRFWILRDLGMAWATKPTSTLTFTYRDIEHTAASNTITEANLGAQYWEVNQWRPGWFTGPAPLGSVDTVTNTVSGVNAGTLGNLYTWVLVDNTNPLPVEFLHFSMECLTDYIKLNWKTASETNNSHFIIETLRNEKWEEVGIVIGNGNTNTISEYEFFYYNEIVGIIRLTQVDYDGSKNILCEKYFNCENFQYEPFIYTYDETIYICYFSEFDDNLFLELYDYQGKLINNWNIEIDVGVNYKEIDVRSISTGIYFIRLNNTIKKIYIKT